MLRPAAKSRSTLSPLSYCMWRSAPVSGISLAHPSAPTCNSAVARPRQFTFPRTQPLAPAVEHSYANCLTQCRSTPLMRSMRSPSPAACCTCTHCDLPSLRRRGCIPPPSAEEVRRGNPMGFPTVLGSGEIFGRAWCENESKYSCGAPKPCCNDAPCCRKMSTLCSPPWTLPSPPAAARPAGKCARPVPERQKEPPIR